MGRLLRRVRPLVRPAECLRLVSLELREPLVQRDPRVLWALLDRLGLQVLRDQREPQDQPGLPAPLVHLRTRQSRSATHSLPSAGLSTSRWPRTRGWLSARRSTLVVRLPVAHTAVTITSPHSPAQQQLVSSSTTQEVHTRPLVRLLAQQRALHPVVYQVLLVPQDLPALRAQLVLRVQQDRLVPLAQQEPLELHRTRSRLRATHNPPLAALLTSSLPTTRGWSSARRSLLVARLQEALSVARTTSFRSMA